MCAAQSAGVYHPTTDIQKLTFIPSVCSVWATCSHVVVLASFCVSIPLFDMCAMMMLYSSFESDILKCYWFSYYHAVCNHVNLVCITNGSHNWILRTGPSFMPHSHWYVYLAVDCTLFQFYVSVFRRDLLLYGVVSPVCAHVCPPTD